MYTFQRYSGIFIFLFLIYHVITTTVAKYYTHDIERDPVRRVARRS